MCFVLLLLLNPKRKGDMTLPGTLYERKRKEERGYRSKWTIVPLHMWQKCKEKEQNIRPEDHNQPTSYWEGTRTHNRHTHESHKPGLSPTCVTLEANECWEGGKRTEKRNERHLWRTTQAPCATGNNTSGKSVRAFKKNSDVTFHQRDRS